LDITRRVRDAIMKTELIPAEGFAASCWLYWDETSGEAVVVDPAADAVSITEKLAQYGLSLKWILLTHGHFDHILSLDELRERTGAPAVIHELDAEMLTDPVKNASAIFLRKYITAKPAEKIVKNDDTLPLGEQEIRVISAPGHTPGCVLYECGTDLFTGDVLFDGSIGRTDLPGGNGAVMQRTLTEICSMENHVLYPGHGEDTTLDIQRQINPFL